MRYSISIIPCNSDAGVAMKRASLMTCFVAAGFLLAAPLFASETFTIGVAPHTSSRIIVEMYQPLRTYLENALGFRVDVVTAPDFDEFARRGLARSYDLAVTTSHQARLFQTDAGYLPMLTYHAEFRSVALAAVDGPIRKPSDLAGKTVLGLSPTSQVTMWGDHWLKANRIRTPPMKYVSASDSIAQLVAAGEAAAGFTSLANYQKLPDELRARLRILAQSGPMPGRVYLLTPRRTAERKKIETALWAFAATPEAKRYFQVNQLEGFRKLKPNELGSMESYAAEVRKTIKEKTP